MSAFGPYALGLKARIAELEAENQRLRDVLERLADGACRSGYGGCDSACKDIAYQALLSTSAELGT